MLQIIDASNTLFTFVQNPKELNCKGEDIGAIKDLALKRFSFLAANKGNLEISKKSEAGVLLDFIKFENNVEEFILSGFNSPKLCFVIYYLDGRKQFKSHTVIVLIYYLVTPAKYRRVIFNQKLDDYLCRICEDIEVRYEIRFLEIEVDKDHVHFLLQSIPMYSPTKIIQILKSITSKKMFKKYPNLKLFRLK